MIKINQLSSTTNGRQIFIGGLLIVIFIAANAWTTAPLAAAQATEDPWSPPVNLSHSGGASKPDLVVDSDGTTHVIWNDAYIEGAVYTRSTGNKWSKPAVVSFPFKASTPTFVPDKNGRIHAFWIDSLGKLFYSQVLGKDFANSRKWSAPSILAMSAINMMPVIDDNNILHLVFVRPLSNSDSPSGVYYRHTLEGGRSWSLPIQLYASPYFRALTKDTANVVIATSTKAGTTRVFVTWDNQPRKQILFAKSFDGGKTWENSTEVDKPENLSVTNNPFYISVKAKGDNTLLLWQNGDPNSSCQQYYEWSVNGGATWSKRQEIPLKLSSCPQGTQILVNSKGIFVLIITVQEQVYLLTWNGNLWSKLEPQKTLSGFIDPETYGQVIYRCRQISLIGENKLFVIGCDQGIGKDIWFTSRLVPNLESDPSQQPSIWSTPLGITSSPFDLSPIALVPDTDGQLHALWSQVEESPPSANISTPTTAIYYAHYDGEKWSHPIIVQKSPNGNASHPSAAIDDTGRLYVVWSQGDYGDIYFSWANSKRAASPSEWNPPLLLPSSQTENTTPYLLVQGSLIGVVYTIPLNEGRGVYFTKSEDRGLTWADPVRVFDAANAKWYSVALPRMARSASGIFHTIWTRESLPGNNSAPGLYYSQSTDGGKTWLQPETITEQKVEWDQLFTLGENIVYRIWQENNNGRHQLKFQYSTDDGANWNRTVDVSGSTESAGSVSSTLDKAGQIHLVQILNDISGKYNLQYRKWRVNSWIPGENLDVSANDLVNVDGLVAAVSSNNTLEILYTALFANKIANSKQVYMLFTNRPLEIPGALPTLPPPTPKITPTSLPTIMPTPLPTPTPVLPPATKPQSYLGLVSLSNSWLGVVSGVGLTLAVIAMAFSLLLKSKRRRG